MEFFRAAQEKPQLPASQGTDPPVRSGRFQLGHTPLKERVCEEKAGLDWRHRKRSEAGMKRKLLAVVIAAFAMVWVGSSDAQTPKKSGATLTGIVVGQNGKSVEHAAVVCQSSGGSSPRVIYTDANGRFTITGLRQDNYDLRASANGFYSNWERNIVVRNGQTREVTVKLVNKDVTP